MLQYIPALMSVVNAGLNLSAKSEIGKKQTEAKKKALELLSRNKLTDNQIESQVQQVGNTFNTAALESLNNNAYGSAGILNSDLVRTIAAAKLAPQRAAAEVQTRQQLYNQNNQINTQMAEIEKTPIEGITTGEAIGQAINTGMQAFSLFSEIENQEEYLEFLKSMYGDNTIQITNPNNFYKLPPKPIINEINKNNFLLPKLNLLGK